MSIDRRTFIAGAGLAFAGPSLAVPLRAASITPAVLPVERFEFKIDGWSELAPSRPADSEAWIAVNASWRASWR